MSILSSQHADPLADVAEPTDAELEAIDNEWPTIEADLEVLDIVMAIFAAQRAVNTQLKRQTRRRTRRVLDKAVV